MILLHAFKKYLLSLDLLPIFNFYWHFIVDFQFLIFNSILHLHCSLLFPQLGYINSSFCSYLFLCVSPKTNLLLKK